MARMWVRLKQISVHEGINSFSNVKVHVKTSSGNVNIAYLNFKLYFAVSYFGYLGLPCLHI